MAFKSYLVTPGSDHQLWLSAPEPVRLSGAQGLVARYLATLPLDATERWGRTDAEWLAQVGLADSESRWLVFEQFEDGRVQLSRLLRINGARHHGQTELLLTLSPLEVTQQGSRLQARAPEDARTWSEELALDGDTQRAGSTWHWCERTLHVGAATFG